MIETTNNKLSYTVGMTAVFPFPIRFFEPEDIHCYLLDSNDVSTELVLGTDFSIETKENYEHGANITLLMDPLPDGQTFTIVREMAITQGVSLPNTGKLPTLSLEKQLDRQIMICQQLKEAQTRTVKLPITSTEDPVNYLDLAIDARAGAETAQGLAEGARDDAQTAQGLAEGARDDAQTAQGLAEGARDDAQTAQGLAEGARDDAQSTVDTHNTSATPHEDRFELIGAIEAHNNDLDAHGGIIGGGGGISILSAISGDAFLYPKTGVVNPFTNADKTPNIAYDVSNYADNVVLLSTSASEPLQLPKFVIPENAVGLKFRLLYAPEASKTWAEQTVVWKLEYKKLVDNTAWGIVVAKDIGTDTTPASGAGVQLFEAIVSLAALDLAVGDIVQSVIFVDPSSTWADKVAFSLCEIEVVL